MQGTISSVGPAVGFPKWCSTTGLYRSYIVHGVLIEIEAYQNEVAGGCAIGLMVQPTASTAPTDLSSFTEQKSVTHLLVPNQKCYLRKYLTTAEVYGQSKETVATADSFSALYNAAPSSTFKMYIGLQGASGIAEHAQMLVRVTQYFEFFGRNTF